MNILESWRTVRAHPQTAVGSGLLGAIPCVGAYVTMHGDLGRVEGPQRWALALTLAACLVFSMRTVWLAGVGAFGERLKSVCVVIAFEGLMACSPTVWLALVALSALIVINAVATACHLVSQDTQPDEPVRVPALSRELTSSRRTNGRQATVAT